MCDKSPGVASTIYYNYKGVCVKEKTTDVNDTAMTGAGFVDSTTVVCKYLDSYGNCTECISGYTLT